MDFKFLTNNNGEVAVEYTEDNLYVQVEDRDTGECFGIPFRMSQQITYKGLSVYEGRERIMNMRYRYNQYEYWIDNVYHTVNHTLVIDVLIMKHIDGAETFHRIIQIIPYSVHNEL